MLLDFPLPELLRLTHFGHYQNRLVTSGDMLHRHFGYEFKWIEQGAFSFLLSPKLPAVELSQGDMLITAPDFPHRFDSGGETISYYWFGYQFGKKIAHAKRSDFPDALDLSHEGSVIDVSYQEQSDSDLQLLKENFAIHRYLIVKNFWEVHHIFQEMKRELTAPKKYTPQIVQLKILEFFSKTLRSVDEAGEQNHLEKWPNTQVSEQLEKVELYLKSHFTEQIRLQQLAHMAGLSEAHFSRLFQKKFHASPIAYAHQLKLEEAKRLLLRGESVGQTASACGFDDPFYFSAFFKSKTNLSPSQYQREVKKTKNDF